MTDRERQLLKLLKNWHDYATSEILRVNDEWIRQLVKATGEVVKDKPLDDNEKKNS